MVLGGEGWYVAGNGRLNQVRPGGAAPRQQGARPQPAAFQPHVPPPPVQQAVAQYRANNRTKPRARYRKTDQVYSQDERSKPGCE